MKTMTMNSSFRSIPARLRNTKAKREEDLTTESTHKQVEISGHRRKGSEWKAVCDEGMVDLITMLNNNNYNTLFSCQGSESGEDPYTPTYVMLRYPHSEIRYTRLVDTLIGWYPDRIITAIIDRDGAINFTMWHVADYIKYTGPEDFTASEIVIYDPRED